MGIMDLCAREISLIGLSPFNAFLFWIIPLAWNIVFARKLPPWFSSRNAPRWITITENVFRYPLMIYPLFLPLDALNGLFIPGLIVYSIGMAVYLAVWLLIILAPDSRFAREPFVRLAPAYLPAAWLTGMSMAAGSLLLPVLSILFIGFHVAETARRQPR